MRKTMLLALAMSLGLFPSMSAQQASAAVLNPSMTATGANTSAELGVTKVWLRYGGPGARYGWGGGPRPGWGGGPRPGWGGPRYGWGGWRPGWGYGPRYYWGGGWGPGYGWGPFALGLGVGRRRRRRRLLRLRPQLWPGPRRRLRRRRLRTGQLRAAAQISNADAAGGYDTGCILALRLRKRGLPRTARPRPAKTS